MPQTGLCHSLIQAHDICLFSFLWLMYYLSLVPYNELDYISHKSNFNFQAIYSFFRKDTFTLKALLCRINASKIFKRSSPTEICVSWLSCTSCCVGFLRSAHDLSLCLSTPSFANDKTCSQTPKHTHTHTTTHLCTALSHL